MGSRTKKKKGQQTKQQKSESLANSSQKEDNANNTTRSSSVLATFSGPLPPPKILSGYDEILPGAAERIVSMAEEQAKHRQGIERQLVDSEVKVTSRGQWFGFILALFALSIGALLIYLEHPYFGAAFSGTTLVGLVSVFVYGKKGRKN